MLLNLPPLTVETTTVVGIFTTSNWVSNNDNKKYIEEIERLQRELNEFKQELRSTKKSRNAWKQKYLVAKGVKKIIRQVDLTRMMRIDSNLNRMAVETLINTKNYYFKLRIRPEGLEDCPITDKVIRLVSMFLRSEYEEKEERLKKQYHFKEEPLY